MLRMKRFLTAILITCVAIATVACAGPAAKSTSPAEGGGDSIKIGAVVSLTGTYAALGRANKNAIELEVARINAAGGIDGRTLEVIFEDDGTDESKAVAAATRLIDQDGVVAIIGASGTGQSMAMRSELARAGVPQVAMAGGNAITSNLDPLVFQTAWPNKLVVPFVLDAMKERGVGKVALLSDTGGYGKDGREIVLDTAEKAGITIVSDQTFNPGDTDMSTQLTKIKSAGADAILLWNAGKEAAIVVKAATDLGVDLPLYGGSGQARLEFLEGSGAAGEGFVFGTGRSLLAENWDAGSEQYETVADFAKRYEAEYGEQPDIFAGHAFDAVLIIAGALERAGADATPAELRDAIEATDGLPGFGGTFSFSATDHNGLTAEDLALYEVQHGTWVTLR